MSTTRYATFCQRRCIFNVASSRRRVPFLSGPVGGSALKGGGHILAVPSHASRGACCHCRYPQSRNDHAHASYGSIVPDHPGQIEYQRRRMWTEESSQQIGLVDNTVLSAIVIVIRQLFGGCRQLLSYRNDFVKLCRSLRDTSDVCTPVCMFFFMQGDILWSPESFKEVLGWPTFSLLRLEVSCSDDISKSELYRRPSFMKGNCD